MIKDCTLLLSSYDDGEDLWEGFFTALKVQWPEMDMPIVLNTETKDYYFEGMDIRTFGVCREKTMPWAKRLKEVLKRIETEYILLFLEDYWLDSPVNDAYFRKSLQWLRENKDIASFSYYPCTPGKNIQDNVFEKMELRPQKCEYKLNCQVAIWRREKLISYLRNHENPWEWEIWGTIRASRYKERFYTLRADSDLVFSYGDPEKGCMIHRGKWVEDVARRMCEMYNLDIDFSVRGFEDFDAQKEAYKSTKQRLLSKDFFREILNLSRICVRKIRSLI